VRESTISSTASEKAANISRAARAGYVEAGGVRYYYEMHGLGEPLLLLHGGLGSMAMFQPLLPLLAAKRTVIAVDLLGHGRTELGEHSISSETIGDDLAAILDALGFGAVDALGYSFGGQVAFQLAARHPERVRHLAIVSAGFAQDGFYPEMIEMQARMGGHMQEFMRDTPMYRSYMAVAPIPSDFPRLLDAMGDWLRRPFDFSAEASKLTMPVMLVYGDSDMFRPTHMVDFYRLLGGGLRDAGWQKEHMSQNRLAILPGLTHYNIFLAPQLVQTVLPFLSGEAETASWSE
jgi:pimeloyl-ACP methyl ester carboxylesterase